MRITYRDDPPFELLARKIRVLPYAYRRQVYGIGHAAVAREVVKRARRKVAVSKTGARRGALKRSLRARRVTGHWRGGGFMTRVPRGEAIVFSLARYARYVEGFQLEGERPPNAKPQPYLRPAVTTNKAGLLRVYRRAVGSHFLETTRQLSTGRVSAMRLRLLRGV